jgi:hypothetical protein
VQLICSVLPAAHVSTGVLISCLCRPCRIQRLRPATHAALCCVSCSTTYVVFDADGKLAQRRVAQGRSQIEADQAQAKEQRENQVVLAALGATKFVQGTRVTDSYAVFADTLEAECAVWEGFAGAVETAKEELGDWREKSEDAYRQAAATLETDPPVVLADIVERIRALTT